MSLNNCTYPVIGRFVAVGIFLADDCGVPIVGPGAGYFDWCPAALSMEDDVTEGDGFSRTCANGTELVNLPGNNTLAGINVDLDLHGMDPTFVAEAGGATPVTQGGEIVGWDNCRDGAGSASLYLWREVVGDEACAGGDAQYLLTVLPWVDQLRITEEGNFGGDDGYLRLTGRSRTGHAFGVGPLPVFPDPTDPDANPPLPFETPIGSDCMRRTVLTSLAPPDDCGIYDVEPEPA